MEYKEFMTLPVLGKLPGKKRELLISLLKEKPLRLDVVLRGLSCGEASLAHHIRKVNNEERGFLIVKKRGPDNTVFVGIAQ